MPNQSRQRDIAGYQRDAAHVRRIAEGLRKDAAMPSHLRDVLITASELVFQALLAVDDPAFARDLIKRKFAQLQKLMEGSQ